MKQIVNKATILKEQDDAAARNRGDSMIEGLPDLRRNLDQASTALQADPGMADAPLHSNKVIELLNLLQKMFAENDVSFRGIVFVKQVALVSVMAKVINDKFASSTRRIQCGAVAGCGYQSESDRRAQLDKFKGNKINILVSTAALEEGIDVSECAFAIRYNKFGTTKAHIHGAGRARRQNAMIYYFENNAAAECQKEACMIATARDASLSLSRADLDAAATSLCVSTQRHPCPIGATPTTCKGLVSVFNCKQIFNQYVSRCLAASVQPAVDLYEYSNEDSDLSGVRYPTPTGWKKLTSDDVLKFWKGADFEKVFVTERSKNLRTRQREELCFVYLVVVILRRQGCIGENNHPNTNEFLHTKQNCPFKSDRTPSISIGSTVFQSST